MSPLFTPAVGQDGALADAIASLAALRAVVKDLNNRMGELEMKLEHSLRTADGSLRPTPGQTQLGSSGTSSGDE